MIEALKWIVVGLAMGVAVEWMRYGSILRSLAGLPKYQADAEKLDREVKGLKVEVAALQAQADLVSSLKAQVSELESRPAMAVAAELSEVTVTESVAGLESVTSLPVEFRVRLEAAGVVSLDDLGSRSEQEILELVEAQPWDDVDAAAWISEAASLSRGVIAAPIAQVSEDDLMELSGVTAEQVAALSAGGFGDFKAISGASEDELLGAIDAQPWDMVDVAAWIEFAKGRA